MTNNTPNSLLEKTTSTEKLSLMEKLHGKNVVVQGITGASGAFHAKAMLNYGTNIIAGTSPNLSKNNIHGVKVYQKLTDIPEKIDISVIFVPAPHAKSAIIEAINTKVPLIICITENIPQHDMLYIKNLLKNSPSTLVGPNSPGILLPNVNKLGIIPANLAKPGPVGIVSRSGTLTYEAMASLTEKNLGQKYVIGIGGDPIKGSGFIDYLELFENDPEIKTIVLIGEIGGKEEIQAAKYIRQNIAKPVYAYIAGHYAPPGVRLGHAGAILGSDQESAKNKTTTLSKSGAKTANSMAELVKLVVDDYS